MSFDHINIILEVGEQLFVYFRGEDDVRKVIALI